MKFELELSEINYVLQALGQRPFAEVVVLINKIQEQAKTQLEPTFVLPSDKEISSQS